VYDLSNPVFPGFINSISLSSYGQRPTSVAASNGVLAVAVVVSSFFPSFSSLRRRRLVVCDSENLFSDPDNVISFIIVIVIEKQRPMS